MVESGIKTTVTQAMKDAMRAKDKPRLAVIRMIQAAFKQKEVDERIELTDQDGLAILDKMAKQRRESIAQFEQANRSDLVEKETEELAVLQSFMPEPLSESQLVEFIEIAIKQTGAVGVRDMGKVMGVLKPQCQGRADMSKVSQMIKEKLSL